MEDMEVCLDPRDAKEVHNKASNKDEQDDSGTHKPKSRFHHGEIVEGKREKKTVQRLDMQMGKPKAKPKVESLGHGDKLGDIARVNHAVGKLKAPVLKPLHKILYDRPGAVSSLRKHIRVFNGFPFEIGSDPYNKKKDKVLRLPKVQLRTICQILDLERSGNQAVLVNRIMQFLTNPTNSGKPVILKKKKKKKTTKDAKREKKSTSQSKKPKLESGKSKAIVTDSSSDDADDDDDEGESKIEDAETLGRQKHEADESKSEGEEEEAAEEQEELVYSDEGAADEEDKETAKSNTKKPSSKTKSSVKKTGKKTEDLSDQSASEDSADDRDLNKTKKKAAAPKKARAKPAPKAKKADSSSSSNKRKNTASKSKSKSESSDEDDEPLIKMIKKPPTDDQLKSAVKDLLKDANLEEVTMKQICQQVYDLYPDFDLTTRKEFIKEMVKSLIT